MSPGLLPMKRQSFQLRRSNIGQESDVEVLESISSWAPSTVISADLRLDLKNQKDLMILFQIRMVVYII
jgi:hypothetical protein